MNRKEIGDLWAKHSKSFDVRNEYMRLEDFTQAVAEIRRQALEEAAKVADAAAMRASTKGLELHAAKQLNETARAYFRDLYLQATATANAIRALAHIEQENKHDRD